MAPYEVIHGQKHMLMESYVPSTSKVQAIDKTLHTGEAIILTLKDNLVMAQNRIKEQVDRFRSKHSFSKGDQVFLHL
jgi:hypothetical protein